MLALLVAAEFLIFISFMLNYSRRLKIFGGENTMAMMMAMMMMSGRRETNN